MHRISATKLKILISKEIVVFYLTVKMIEYYFRSRRATDCENQCFEDCLQESILLLGVSRLVPAFPGISARYRRCQNVRNFHRSLYHHQHGFPGHG